MTSFTYFTTLSDINVILSEGLFLHVAAQIYIFLMYRFDGAIVQAKNIRCIYSFFNIFRRKNGKSKTKLILAIGHQKYRIDKPVISTFFFIGINYMLVKNNWFDFCFTALQHILGHFGRGQLT